MRLQASIRERLVQLAGLSALLPLLTSLLGLYSVHMGNREVATIYRDATVPAITLGHCLGKLHEANAQLLLARGAPFLDAVQAHFDRITAIETELRAPLPTSAHTRDTGRPAAQDRFLKALIHYSEARRPVPALILTAT
jgi:hypothetical protein